MADYADKAVDDVGFIESILEDVKHPRFRNAVFEWLTGSGRLDELLDITPPLGLPHPAVVCWRVRRDEHIQQAGVLCSKPSMERTLIELISEIKAFHPFWNEYGLNNPNPLWSPVHKKLFWAFKYHFTCGESQFPVGKTTLRKILMRHDYFRSAPGLPERNELLLKWNHERRAKKVI